jgi:hypothetical protein
MAGVAPRTQCISCDAVIVLSTKSRIRGKSLRKRGGLITARSGPGYIRFRSIDSCALFKNVALMRVETSLLGQKTRGADGWMSKGLAPMRH